jgi:hypothetical protein
MNQEIIDRLEYVEETYAGEIETWHDPVTDTLYHVPVKVVRDWDNIKKLTRTIKYTTNNYDT